MSDREGWVFLSQKMSQVVLGVGENTDIVDQRVMIRLPHFTTFCRFFFLFRITLFLKIISIVHVSCNKCKQF